MGCLDGFPTDLVLQSTLHGFEDAFRDYGFCCPQERITGSRVALVDWDEVEQSLAGRRNHGDLQYIQYQGLKVVAGAFKATSTAALEIECYVKPIPQQFDKHRPLLPGTLSEVCPASKFLVQYLQTRNGLSALLSLLAKGTSKRMEYSCAVNSTIFMESWKFGSRD
ncbi:hypothetical protein DL98DRAFT_615612 [Cadophora sp. DSE1049]|nr:hypothetical protein DL98DRAFT_615612 [Cadophora sp. DSE1049]